MHFGINCVVALLLFFCFLFSSFRREFQAVINTVNINIGPTIENYGGEIFLSQELAMNILQETKLAFKRCKVVSIVFALINFGLSFTVFHSSDYNYAMAPS